MKRLFLVLSLVATVNLMSMVPVLNSGEDGDVGIEIFDNFQQEGEVVQVPEAVATQFGVFANQMSDSLFDKTVPLAAMVEPNAFKKLLAALQKEDFKSAIKEVDHSSLPGVLKVADYLLLDEEKVDLIIEEVAEKLGEIGIDSLINMDAPLLEDLIMEKWLEGNKDKALAAGCPLDWSLKQTLPSGGVVRSVTISSDGQTIVSVGADRTVNIWNLGGDGRWALRQILEESVVGDDMDWIYSVAISNDGQIIVSGSTDGTVRIWSLDGNGNWVIKQTLGQDVGGHTDWVESVAISNDSRTIVSGSYDGTVKIWSLGVDGSWDHRQSLAVGSGDDMDWVNSVAISNDGRTIVFVGREDGTVKIWSLGVDGSWDHRQSLGGDMDLVESATISDDGRTIVSDGKEDGAVKIWNLGVDGSWTLRQTLDDDEDWVHLVAISKDGKTIVSGSVDRVVKIWSLGEDGSWAIRQTLDQDVGTGAINSVAISDDGKTIVSSRMDRAIKIWSAPEDCKLTLPIVYAIEKEDISEEEKSRLIERIDFGNLHPGIATYLRTLGISRKRSRGQLFGVVNYLKNKWRS